MEGIHRTRYGGKEWAELPCPLQARGAPSTLMCSPTQKLSEPHCLGFFYGGLITGTGPSAHSLKGDWTKVIDSISSHSPLLEVGGTL